MSRVVEARGRPVAVLALVLLGWVAMRASFWEAPADAQSYGILTRAPLMADAQSAPDAQTPQLAAVDEQLRAERRPGPFATTESVVPRPAPEATLPPPRIARVEPSTPALSSLSGSSGGHQMLWLAAMSQLPVPTEIEDQLVTGTGPNAPQPDAQPEPDRWSVDAWSLWRQGSNIAQGRRPSYGASQAGAVLNFRLRPSSRHDPRVFARAFRALIDRPETEFSVGVSGRPLPDIPVRLHGEMRATERFGQFDYRPSAFATTELPPFKLPLGAQAEIYGQAGYVWGDFPTGFADGQLHIMRELKQFDFARFSLGAGAWGGIQKGTERVDLGPSMRMDLKVGSVPARVSLDWRERVAGDAEPGSGVAVTLSTRF